MEETRSSAAERTLWLFNRIRSLASCQKLVSDTRRPQPKIIPVAVLNEVIRGDKSQSLQTPAQITMVRTVYNSQLTSSQNWMLVSILSVNRCFFAGINSSYLLRLRLTFWTQQMVSST